MKMRGLSLAARFIYGGLSNVPTNNLLRSYVVSRLHGDESVYADCGSLGVVRDGKILGAVLFHNWQPDYGTIELSAAADSPRWLSRKTINEVFRLCFEQFDCQQVYSRMAADNIRAAKIYDFLGFKRITLPNMRGAGRDEFLMLLTRQEWREVYYRQAKNAQSP